MVEAVECVRDILAIAFLLGIGNRVIAQFLAAAPQVLQQAGQTILLVYQGAEAGIVFNHADRNRRIIVSGLTKCLERTFCSQTAKFPVVADKGLTLGVVKGA